MITQAQQKQTKQEAMCTQIHINNYIEHLPNELTTIMREKGTDKYENVHDQNIVIESTRRQDLEHSTLRTFCKLKVCKYKKTRQSGQ